MVLSKSRIILRPKQWWWTLRAARHTRWPCYSLWITIGETLAWSRHHCVCLQTTMYKTLKSHVLYDYPTIETWRIRVYQGKFRQDPVDKMTWKRKKYSLVFAASSPGDFFFYFLFFLSFFFGWKKIQFQHEDIYKFLFNTLPGQQLTPGKVWIYSFHFDRSGIKGVHSTAKMKAK